MIGYPFDDGSELLRSNRGFFDIDVVIGVNVRIPKKCRNYVDNNFYFCVEIIFLSIIIFTDI